MRMQQALIIARKDFDEFRKNRYVFWTILGMPAFFAMIGPIMLLVIPFSSVEAIERQQLLTLLLGMVLIMLAIIPGILPSIIASYSFVGEKINRSLEPLLATPTTDSELLLGKSLAVFIPTMIGTYLAYLISIVAIDIILFPVVGGILLPDLPWIVVMFLVAPALCITAIEANVFISSRMSDVRAAQQFGGLIITPMMIVLFASIANVFPITLVNMLILAFIMSAIALGLFKFSQRLFRREKILTQWK